MMNTPEKNVTDPKALQNIMLALKRLMKIGIYYPSGHSVLEKALNNFQQHLIKVAGDEPLVRFSIADGKMYLQGILLDEKFFFVPEFRQTLSRLTIKELEISRDIRPDEVIEFIKKLIVYRSKYKANSDFASIDLVGFPLSVKVIQAQYLARQSESQQDGDSNGFSGREFKEIEKSLQGHGLSSFQIDQCRQLFENISQQQQQGNTDTLSDDLSLDITWTDVERLILKIVKKSEDEEGEQLTKTKQELNALVSKLNVIGEEKAHSSSVKAANLLVSLTKKEAGETIGLIGESKPDDVTSAEQLSVADIIMFISTHSAQFSSSKDFLLSDNSETLTIVLQLLRQEQTLKVQYRVQQMLRKILSTDLNEHEMNVLLKGILSLIKEVEDARLSIIMAMLIEPIRKSEQASSFSILAEIVNRSDFHQLRRILPYIINELLIVGRQDEPKLFDQMCNKFLYLPDEYFQSALPRFQKLAAFTQQNVVENLFYKMPKEYYPLFSFLFNTSLEPVIHKRLYSALELYKPDWFIEAMLPLLRERSPLSKKLFIEYLQEGGPSEPTAKMKDCAVQIIFDVLPQFADEKEQAPEILNTIKAIPLLGDDKLKRVLEIIINSRNMIILPQWPANVRKAAKEALSIMGQKGKARRRT